MKKNKLAIYDLDSTITKRDTLYYFILFLIKNKAIKIFNIVLPLIRHLLIKKDAIMLKDVILSSIIPKNKRDIDNLCRKFVDSLADNIFRKEVIQLINDNKKNNFTLIMLTAAYNLYAELIAEKLNFDYVISSQVVFIDDKLTGLIKGNYITGKNKISALRQKIDIDAYDLNKSRGYGNKDDLPWLKLLGYYKIY